MIDEATIEAYAADGAVPLRGILDDATLDLRRPGIDANMASPSEYSCEYTPDGSPGRFWDDYCNWQRIPEYRQVLFESPLAEAAAALMQSETARLFHEHVLVKEPGTTELTPWHHDQPYYCVNGDQNISLWVPLDPVPVESSIRFVAGSHRGPMYVPMLFMTNEPYPYDGFDPVPDIEAELDRHRILQWAVDPGDVIAFHMRTLHSAAGSATRRRAFSARFVGDDATYAVRPAPTSPPFPEVAAVLGHGDPLDHPTFPVLYPQG